MGTVLLANPSLAQDPDLFTAYGQDPIDLSGTGPIGAAVAGNFDGDFVPDVALLQNGALGFLQNPGAWDAFAPVPGNTGSALATIERVEGVRDTLLMGDGDDLVLLDWNNGNWIRQSLLGGGEPWTTISDLSALRTATMSWVSVLDAGAGTVHLMGLSDPQGETLPGVLIPPIPVNVGAGVQDFLLARYASSEMPYVFVSTGTNLKVFSLGGALMFDAPVTGTDHSFLERVPSTSFDRVAQVRQTVEGEAEVSVLDLSGIDSPVLYPSIDLVSTTTLIGGDQEVDLLLAGDCIGDFIRLENSGLLSAPSTFPTAGWSQTCLNYVESSPVVVGGDFCVEGRSSLLALDDLSGTASLYRNEEPFDHDLYAAESVVSFGAGSTVVNLQISLDSSEQFPNGADWVQIFVYERSGTDDPLRTIPIGVAEINRMQNANGHTTCGSSYPQVDFCIDVELMPQNEPTQSIYGFEIRSYNVVNGRLVPSSSKLYHYTLNCPSFQTLAQDHPECGTLEPPDDSCMWTCGGKPLQGGVLVPGVIRTSRLPPFDMGPPVQHPPGS